MKSPTHIIFIVFVTLFIMFFVNSGVFASGPSATASVDSINVGARSAINGNVSPQQDMTFEAPLIQDNSVHQASDLARGRGFVVPGEIIFPGTPGYFGEVIPGHRFIPLNKLLMYTTSWNVEAARNMLKGETGHKDVEIRDLIITKNNKSTNTIYCSIIRPDAGNVIEQISIGTIAATNKKSISADVLASAIVAASDRGANYIQFMAEGVNREVDASGWGIGFNTTQAQVYSGDNGKSNVSSAGMGYSRGWSGYIDYPWMQFTFLRVDMPEVAADAVK